MKDLYVCPRCGGATFEFYKDNRYIQRCPLCKGKGKVDWITKAMGYEKKKTERSNK